MPLTLNDIRDRLADHREALRNFKVRSLFVFGSLARGEANQGATSISSWSSRSLWDSSNSLGYSGSLKIPCGLVSTW